MRQTVLPYTQVLRLKPRVVTRSTAEEAHRLVCRSFALTEIHQLHTNHPIRGGSSRDVTSSVAAGAASITALLASPALTDTVPLGATVELTNLTIHAESPRRTLKIAISPSAVAVDIAGADEDWVQARGRELQALFIPHRRPWQVRSTTRRRDFLYFGLAADTLITALLLFFLPQAVLEPAGARAILFAALCLTPALCWLTGARITRRCRVRIGDTDPAGWWQSTDTMTKLTLGLLIAALLAIALDAAQNGLTSNNRPSAPHSLQAPGKDGAQ